MSKELWRQELESIYSNKVYDLVEAPKGIKPIGCKWVYERKRGVDGNVETYKTRLIAKGMRPFHMWSYSSPSEYSYPLHISIIRYKKWMSRQCSSNGLNIMDQIKFILEIVWVYRLNMMVNMSFPLFILLKFFLLSNSYRSQL